MVFAEAEKEITQMLCENLLGRFKRTEKYKQITGERELVATGTTAKHAMKSPRMALKILKISLKKKDSEEIKG